MNFFLQQADVLNLAAIRAKIFFLKILFGQEGFKTLSCAIGAFCKQCEFTLKVTNMSINCMRRDSSCFRFVLHAWRERTKNCSFNLDYLQVLLFPTIHLSRFQNVRVENF